jgi:hypothetical protein
MHRPTHRSHPSPAQLLAACTCTLFVAALAWPANVVAQDVPCASAAPEPSREPVSLRMHASIFMAGAATTAAVGLLQSRLAPASCRWCDLHADGTDAVNGPDRRRAARWLWDVLASVGVGTAMGLVVPRLVFKARPSGSSSGARVAAAPVISCSLVGVSYTW